MQTNYNDFKKASSQIDSKFYDLKRKGYITKELDEAHETYKITRDNIEKFTKECTEKGIQGPNELDNDDLVVFSTLFEDYSVAYSKYINEIENTYTNRLDEIRKNNLQKSLLNNLF